MSELPLSIIAAERRAKDILAQYAIDAPEHIRVRDLAYVLGAGVVEGPLHGAAARLICGSGVAIIRISDRENYEGRKRFSIAHELGHFVLGHAKDAQIVCTDNDMIAPLRDSNRESEANAFAGELLLPTHLVAKSCDVRKVTFGPIREIANRFRTSLTATVLKFVRLCPEMCAAVYCTGGIVKWVAKSKDFWPYIEINKSLDRRTLAYDFFSNGPIREEPEEVDADAWLDSQRLGGIEEVVEHSTRMPSLNSVLTLIWIRS